MGRRSRCDDPLDRDWTARAERMRLAAEQMPPGSERNEALRLAHDLKAAAALRRALETSD